MPNSVKLPEFLTRFRCLGAECTDTCCQGWNMQLSDNNYKKYQNEAPELLDSVVGKSGEYIMKRNPASDYCVKFEGGLCGIQKKYGENFLGDACYFYPRATRTLGSSLLMTAALSCPEIARLALFDDDAFDARQMEISRLPESLKDYLPEGLDEKQAIAIHEMFLRQALDKTYTPERTLIRIFTVAESLERISMNSWADAVPFYFEHADSSLPAPEGKGTDQPFLLQALCGLVVAAKKVHNKRLMQTIYEMEQALHVSVRMDTLAIVPLPDAAGRPREIQKQWEKYEALYAPVLSRYLAMQLSLALFPFAGFGGTLTERIAVIGIRFATVKLALQSACALAGKPLTEEEIVRVVQSLSRFLDHLAEKEFSLKIYEETGWLKKSRLRALLVDAD